MSEQLISASRRVLGKRHYDVQMLGGIVAAYVAPNQDQAAPTGLDSTAVTATGNDGTITGVNSEMEYRLKDAADWTNVTGTEIMGLAAGTYEVRYAAKEGFNAGAVTEVPVAADETP